MPNRYIGVNRNDRDVLYGVHSKTQSGIYWSRQQDGEVIDYRFDLKNWLDDGETVINSVETANSLTANKSLNPQSIDFVIEGCGYLETLIETSSGKKKKIKLYIVDPEANYLGDYYDQRYSYGN